MKAGLSGRLHSSCRRSMRLTMSKPFNTNLFQMSSRRDGVPHTSQGALHKGPIASLAPFQNDTSVDMIHSVSLISTHLAFPE